jgi:hypothetical protein
LTETVPDIKAIFVEALDLASDAERTAYLERACAGVPDVRMRVEALLAAIGQAGSFLETPALFHEARREPGAGVDSTALEVEAVSGDGSTGLSTHSTPSRLGDFELVRRLGEGARGVVFEARQVSLNRAVAVKMIRAGLFAGEADLRRFRIETEAVAHLDHPRINFMLK